MGDVVYNTPAIFTSQSSFDCVDLATQATFLKTISQQEFEHVTYPQSPRVKIFEILASHYRIIWQCHCNCI